MPTALNANTSRHQRPLFIGVLFTSMSVLLLQIALARIFSFTIWHHFAYVTISVALLGYRASSTLVSVAPRLAEARRLALYAFATSASILVTLTLSAIVPFHPFHDGDSSPRLSTGSSSGWSRELPE